MKWKFMQSLIAPTEQCQVRYDNDLFDDEDVKQLFMNVGRCWSLRCDLDKLNQGKGDTGL